MPVGCPYTLSFDSSSFATSSGDYDFWEITPADDAPIEIVGFHLAVLSEIGDTQEEFLRVGWFSENATTGNGTSTTPRPVNSRVTHASPPTCEVVASSPASAGTAIQLEVMSIPARGGDRIWYPDQTGFVVAQSDTMLCLRLISALTDDASIAGTCWFNIL